jgi:hypothetical protein
LRALDDLIRQGKVRYIGNSNFPAWRIAEAEYVARAINVNRFISCQDEYSLVVRDIEKDLLPAARQYDLGLLPFFPLASGLLTGKYKRGAAAPEDTRLGKSPALRDRYVTPRNEDIVEKLQAFAQARGHSMLELAFSWLASRPQVASVIAGATRRRAGRAECQGDRVGAQCRGDRGDRWDYEGVGKPRNLHFVVPANAGTHTPRPLDFGQQELIPPATINVGGYGSRLALRLAGTTQSVGAANLTPPIPACSSRPRCRETRSAPARPRRCRDDRARRP